MKTLGLFRHIEPFVSLFRLKPFDASSDIGRSYERYRRIALSGSSSILSKIVISVIGLISVPLTINYLGKEQFGLWMVMSSCVIWLQISEFGVSNGLVNALAEANGRNDKLASCSYFSTAFYSLTSITVIMVVPIILIAFFVPWGKALNIQDSSLIQDAKYCFAIIGLFFFINIPLSLGNKALVAFQKGYLANITQIVASVCSLLLLITAIVMKLNLVWLVSLVSVGAVLGNLFSWIFLYQDMSWLRLKFKHVSRNAFNRIIHSSFPLFLFQIGSLFLNQSANIILAYLAGLQVVADYNILLKIYILIYSMGISFSSPFYPAIREAYERKENRWVFNATKRVLLVRLAILIILTSPLIFFGDRMIALWIRQPLSENFGYIGWLCFLICMILAGLSATLSEILIILDYIFSQLHSVFANAFVFIISAILLVPHYELVGFYISFIIGMIYPTLWAINKIRSVMALI